MKTSNKLLLGVFLVVVLGIIGIYSSLYAKLQSSNYIRVEGNRFGEILESHDLPATKNIIISGLSTLFIVAADTNINRLDISKNVQESNNVFFYQQGDNLIIRGDSLYNKSEPHEARASRPVTLYLNRADLVKIINANCTVYGNHDSAAAKPLSLELEDVNLTFVGGNNAPPPQASYWSKLTITGTDASIYLMNDARIGQLDVSLKTSRIIDNGGHIGKLSVQADEHSELNLKGVNINTITPKQP